MAQINKPSDYFNTVLYTGNGSTQTISGVGFQPDWTWVKVRSEVGSHRLADAVRGNTKYLFSNGTDAEATDSTNITSWNSDGFALGSGSVNESSRTYAAWNWKANGSGSSNGTGSITATVSANTTSGFSIVSYTGNGSNGATIAHGLGAAPKMVIIKKRSNTAQWAVGGTNIDSTFNGYLFLDDTIATATSDNVFNDTAPSSSFVTLGTTGDSNASGETYIAYCFAEKQGYSKFGSYTGNGSTDGTFVYTGFKPAFVIFKRTNTTNDWFQMDNKVHNFNKAEADSKMLRPNLSNAEQANNTVDLLSNGFKARNGNDAYNNSGSTYIYMAFAENPLVGTNNIPATAR